jgi:hypothetical protein
VCPFVRRLVCNRPRQGFNGRFVLTAPFDRILVDGGRTVVFEYGQAPPRSGASISKETMTVFW